jgi:hypothetical protein
VHCKTLQEYKMNLLELMAPSPTAKPAQLPMTPNAAGGARTSVNAVSTAGDATTAATATPMPAANTAKPQATAPTTAVPGQQTAQALPADARDTQSVPGKVIPGQQKVVPGQQQVVQQNQQETNGTPQQQVLERIQQLAGLVKTARA